MTAGRYFLRASNRDAIIKNEHDWIWDGSTFKSLYAGPVENALRFRSLDEAKQVAAHLRRVIPNSRPRAKRATYPEQAGFDKKYKAIEVENAKA